MSWLFSRALVEACLGGGLVGFRTVCAVEVNAYAARVLLARQNDGILPPFPVWDDVGTFDGKPWRGIVEVVSGGFPCQDISIAGKGAGIDGNRSSLWGEMARIIGEVRPRLVFVENSPAITVRGLWRVLGDLAALGFDARWGVVSAADIGACHERKRLWLVAGHFDEQRLEARRLSWGAEKKFVEFASGGWWKTEPGVVRVADGGAARVDRIKALGNMQVPMVAATAFQYLSEDFL